MFSRVRIAIRFFFVGLAVGIMLAPRSGEQTRKMLRAKADELLNNILDAASMGVEPEPEPEPAAKSPARGTRSRNGSGSRTRAKAEDVAEETAEAAEAASA
jgi:gas vesicle protein